MLLVAAAAAVFATASTAPVDAFPLQGPQFDPLLDLHVSVYEPDFRWQRTWEESLFLRVAGLKNAQGSTSQHELFTDRGIVLNVPLLPAPVETERVAPRSPLWLRYEREEHDDDYLQLNEQRLELQIAVVGPLSVSIIGWPEYEKSTSIVGGGLFLADEKRTSYLGARVELDHALFNQRTRLPARYAGGEPLRFRGEGNFEHGAFRAHAFLDWDDTSRLVFDVPIGSDGIRVRTRAQRRTEEKLEWTPAPDALVGIRHRYLGRAESREYFPGYVDPQRFLDGFDFASDQHRVDLYGDRSWRLFRVRAQTGWMSQHDDASFALRPGYRFHRGEFLSGLRGYWRGAAPGLELGLGYWGNVFRADREVDASASAWRDPPWRTRRENGYADKGDFSIGYVLPGERLRLEGILSHEVSGGRFGGGCVKALLLF